MATAKSWLGLGLIASFFCAITSKACPNGWKEYGSSCYLFVIPNMHIRQMSWEDSRANCRGYGADIVSILNSSEANFIYQQTHALGNYRFWIGLYRNKTTSDPKEGWVWSDGSNFTNPQRWLWGEPNNYQNNEDCAELFAKSKRWNDNDCSKSFSSICKRKKGLPDPTVPTPGTPPPTKDPPPTCGHGWIAYNRSCYKMFGNRKSWSAAQRACRDTGGHLVRIDNDGEQRFLASIARPKNWNFWIGLNDLKVAGNWVWEFRSQDPMVFKHWQSGEPNQLGVEQCVEMYGHAQAGFWNDARCNGYKSYICEKEEGQNVCPEGWIAYNDTCYQFNMNPTQKMTWSDAKAACNAIGDFSTLLTISSQSEQNFINQRIQTLYGADSWIGLNDNKNEGVFRWSADNTLSEYQIWANGKPSENRNNLDCVKILSVRKDGAWSVQNCSQKENYICMRHRDLPFCNIPLGMETGKILDSQITATSSLSSNGPAQARFRHSGSWCPAKADKNEYLQVVLPYLTDIRKIVTQGNVTSYKLKVSKEGKKFRDYNPSANPNAKQMIPTRAGDYAYIDTTDLFAKVVRIYPHTWTQYPCLRVEFIGCPAQAISTECTGKNWEKGPGKLCFQINRVYKTWEDARSTCLDRGGDLLAIATKEVKTAIGNRIVTGVEDFYWISLNDRDYRNIYDWSDNSANGLISWGSGAPDLYSTFDTKACVKLKRTGKFWSDNDCSTRLPFICMKGGYKISTYTAYSGLTGVWMGSARYYWPLSYVDNNMIFGTKLGKVNGKVTSTSGVKGKPNTALQFASAGSYIDLGQFDKECLGDPNHCFGLSLSFMASFDKTAVNWDQRISILDSVEDETKYRGLIVYIKDSNLYFVVSKSSEFGKTSVPIVDSKWTHFVMRYNSSSGISVSVNGVGISAARTQQKNADNDKLTNFKIGLQSPSVKSGQVKLAMVAFWEKVLSDYDISSIYKAEFGTCPYSWMEYGMSCYQINTDTKSYYYADLACQKSGGGLTDITSNVEQAFISTKVTVNIAWTGLHDKNNEGLFIGSDGKQISYSNWDGKQPDNYWNNEDCGHIKKGGMWNDLPCYYNKPYICEKQKEVNVKPTNITTTATPVSDITKNVLACHYTRVTIGCPSGFAIKINAAFWGRRDKKKCIYISVQPCGVKDIDTITKNLQKKCDNSESCILHASEKETYLNNNCPTVSKYLEVDYNCTKGSARTICKPGWVPWMGTAGSDYSCYRLFDTPKTWNDAKTACNNAYNGADLLSINGNLEQLFATSLMEQKWYADVWIGLNDLKTKGVYEWSDKSSVSWTNWYVGQPDEKRTDKSCVYMSLRRSKRGWMYWRDQNCTNKYAFVCKYNMDTTTQKPATTPTVYKGNCNNGWVTNDKLAYCYYYGGRYTKSNWVSAKASCDYKGSKLVSIQSTLENEFVRKLSNNTIWIGLETRGVFRGHVWTDKQPVRYTNWDVGQPDSYNGLDACVAMNPDTGVWSDRDCNEKKNVVCKKSKLIIPVTTAPVIYPTPGSSDCRPGWTLYKGMCYIAGNDTSSEYQTWHNAEKRCQSIGNSGHLASVHEQDEQKFLKFLVKSHYSNNFWLGLNDLGTEAAYQWSDGSNYDYLNWDSGEPNDYHRQENCIHLIRTNGKWNDQHCQRKLSYICKAYKESYKPPVKPTDPPRPPSDEYCPKGWIAHAQYCYEFHTNATEYRSWDDAKEACELGHNGELASIHDEFEEAFITTQIKGAEKHLWIGMNSKHGSFFWADNTPSNYFKWNTREPGWGWNRCVEIVPYHWAAGRWNAPYCSKLNGYICKKAASKTPVTPTKTPTVSKCKSGYKSYDQSCFKLIKTKQTFDDARKVCQKDKGDLMIVDSQFKQAYLIYISERYVGNVWIGLYHEPYSSFKFVDQTSVPHTYWGAGQPSRQLAQRSCTQANVTGSNFGVWDDVDCNTANSFICEIYKGDPKVTIPLNGTCPSGWKAYNKHCYKHFAQSKRWSQAQFVCSSFGADLVSIHDDKEQDFLIYFYQSRHPIRIWTGLNDRAVENGFKWIDNSPSDYVNWQRGEPNNWAGFENCVEMQTRSGQWNDLPCNYFKQFMCKKNMECSSVIPVDSSSVTVTDTFNATAMGADKAIITDEKDYNSIWCTNNTSGTAKIMIDFSELVRITAIKVMGSSSRFVKSFRIDYERDENWRAYYPYGDSQVALHQYSSSVSTKKLKSPIVADGLSITPLTWSSGNLVCMKIRLLGCEFVCQRQLFLSNPSRIKHDVITASSAKYPENEPKQTGILGHSWCAEKNDKNQWIQFSFDKERVISVVRTFGDRVESYVKTYSMQFSGDGVNWTDYEQHGVKRIFQGNNDANSGMRHNLANQIETSYVRIIPITWNKNICMRISLLGCEADCSKPLLSSGQAPKAQYFSSDKYSNPEYALFNSGKAWCTSNSPLKKQYLEIKLGDQYIVSKIATQPSPLSYKNGSEVTTFTMQYQKGRNWYPHGPKGQAKIMDAINENDKSKLKVNMLTDYYRNKNGIKTGRIRVYPYTYTGKKICMRVELYGCLAAVQVVPTKQPTAQRVVDVSVRFTNIEWNDKLNDKKSEEFDSKSKKITQAVEKVYSGSESFRSAEVLKFTKGSVIAKIKLVFNSVFADGDNEMKLADAVKKGKVGTLEVDKNSFKIYERVVDVFVRFTSIEWNDKLNDKKSEEFDSKSKMITQGVKIVYSESESFRSAEVLKLTKGSVIAKIKLVFNSEFAAGDNEMKLAAAVKKGKVGTLEVDKNSFKIYERVVNVSVRFTSIGWNDKLNDKKSEEFDSTSKNITQAVEKVYSGSESFRSAIVLKLTKGSVIAKIKLVFNSEFADGDNEMKLADAVKKGKVGALEVDKNSFKIDDGKTEASTGDENGGLSGGAVAGVVITVLILVGVAAGVAFFVFRRKKRNSLFSPKHFDNPITYSSKAYDIDD